MRLIDADAIMKRLTHAWDGTPTVENYRDGAPVLLEIREIKDLIRNAPTVSPWVNRADRLPEEKDGDHVLVATYDADRRQWIRWVTSRGLVKSCPQIEWWTPIPTLPEAAK